MYTSQLSVPHQTVHERFPAGDDLDLVEEAVDRLGVLLLRMEREVGVCDDAEAVALEVPETVVEEVQVEDVVARNPAVEQPLHQLEQEGRLPGASRTDADGRLARYRRHVDAARDARGQLGLAKVQDEVPERVVHWRVRT